jgi:nitroreductase
MDVEDAIRRRRTHKRFGPEPLARETLEELFELARHAPNHRLTEPWRFRVLGPQTLAALKEAGGEKEAAKLERAPTIVCVCARLTGDVLQLEEELHATAAALYSELLSAEARGLAAYWRTPALLRTAKGRELAGLRDGERFVGLVYLGPRVAEPPAKERRPLASCLEYLP